MNSFKKSLYNLAARSNVVFIILAFFIITSCNNSSKYPGYTESRDGIYFKLLAIGEDNKKAEIGDYITVDIAYKTLNDSVFFSGRRKFQIIKSQYPGSIDECFIMIAQGEKSSFILSSQNFFLKTLQTKLPSFLKPGSDMKVEINMLEIQTQEQYEHEKQAFLAWIDDFNDYEKEILRQYISREKMDAKPTKSGLYYLKIKPGNGHKVNKGDTVVVDYEGKFLNGKFFDSTKKRHEPFQFVYGTEWQVVKGLDETIGMMEEGETALVILPSELAFGREGSSTGIIPPFTSLIFEVELKKIN
jgi:FKBP-type peptidyl-prolyl cis-trans isomerase FkpA